MMDKNEVEMPKLRSCVGLQGQVEILRDVLDMPLQSLHSEKGGSMITREELERFYWQGKKSEQKIADELGVTRGSVSHLMTKFEIPRRSKSEGARWIEVNVNPSETLAYVLGVIKGDGCVNIGKNGRGHTQGRVLLGQTRPEFARSFEMALRNLGFNSNTFIQKKRCKQGFIYLTYGNSLKFARWYKQLSLEDIEKILGGNPPFIKSFIRGFYESEGCNFFGKQQGKYLVWTIALGNTDEELSRFVLDLLVKLGFNFGFTVNLHRCTRWSEKPYFMLYNSKKHENLRFINEIKPCFKNQVIENPPPPREKWSKDRVIYRLKKFVAENGFSPSQTQAPYVLTWAMKKYFGTFNKAKKAASIKVNPNNYDKKMYKAKGIR